MKKEKFRKADFGFLLIIAISWLLHFSLFYGESNSSSSLTSFAKQVNGTASFTTSAINNGTNCGIGSSSGTTFNSIARENSNLPGAALIHYNFRLVAGFKQYLRQSFHILINFRKSDLLFPAHYFW